MNEYEALHKADSAEIVADRQALEAKLAAESKAYAADK